MDIKKILQSSYKKESFIEFIYDKFYGFEENSFGYEQELLNDTEKKHIQKYKFLGQVELDDDKEIGFFEVITTDNIDIENNRVSLNNILKKKAEDELLDGAIAVFTNPSKPNIWRLSFIRFSYDENDKQQVTNLKRFTFVLGEQIPIKTAYQQLKDLKYPKLDNIEKAFSVEKISKEFFIDYKKLYFELCDYLKPQLVYFKYDKNIKLFTKKILGRIVFLYFLEKKGWLGSDENWKNGDKRFLTNHFNKYNGEDFYTNILQPIFFEALNTNREDRNHYFEKLDCKMPFLNGGLFSQDEFDKKDIIIEDKIFEDIFKTFDSYNFTIIEDSPQDSEVAIDPEVLGRVFEDLLEDRKDKGAFYTPREIVHYMCQQSIKNYMDTKPKDITELEYIKKIKILDPAIGSGAFPMGMLHEIVIKRQELEDKTKLGTLKKEIIQNSIYGVDIEPSAVEIAKLRFWLSIVVDEDKPTPLPNLFYKIMVGNSLLETVNGFDPLGQHGNTNEMQSLKNKFHKFFNETNNKEKEKINEEIKRNIGTILQLALKKFDIQPSLDMDKKEQKEYEEKFEKYMLLKQIIQDYKSHNATTQLFLYKIYFKEVLDKGGFDVVIGNPPYVRQEKIKELKSKKEIQNFESYNGTADLYIYFFEKGYKLLKVDGVLSYITSNKYTRAKYGKDFRKFVLENSTIKEYVDFNGVKVFESATVDTSILTYQKAKIKDNNFVYCDINEKYKKGTELNKFIDEKGFDYSQNDLNESSFSFSSPQELRIKKQIEKVGTRLKEWDINIFRGIPTGCNDAFIINEEIKDELISKDKNNNDLIKPLLRGKDVKKYEYKYSNLYMIFVKFNSHSELEKNYPYIFEHLNKFKDILQSRAQVKNGQHHWLELDNCPQDNLVEAFDNIKLVYPDIRDKLSFTIDTRAHYFNNTLYFINTGSKYLLALLNAKIVNHYYTSISSQLGNKGLRAFSVFIKQIPIPQISKEKQKPFEILVDYILFAKEQDMKNEASLFESIIDNMVYDLYFEEDMKKADCFISSRIKELDLKSFDIIKEDELKKEYIKVVYEVFQTDQVIKKCLIFSKNIETIKIINGK